MKLVSRFKDYYDGVAQYGFDNDLVFVRETKEDFILVEKTPKFVNDVLNLAGYQLDNNVDFLFFCGKVYPLFRYTVASPTYETLHGTAHDFIKDQKNRIEKRELNYYPYPKFFEGDEKSGYFHPKYAMSEKGVLGLEKHCREIVVPGEVFVEFDCPYFIFRESGRHHNHIIKNPILQKYGFPKHLDSFSAFQEIRMYLGNVMTTPDMNPVTVGDDRIIAQQKGFDDMSFRTMAPGKKKENRKLNRARKKGAV